MFLSFQGAPAHPGLTLYCLPHAGGSASAYAPWVRALAPGIAVVGVDFPAHGSRFDEPPLGSIAEMAAELAAEILHRAPGPFALYGHSLGALVAYETALLLEESGSGPGQVLVGAARAPHIAAPRPLVHGLEPEEFLSAVERRYGGLPAGLRQEQELLELVLPALQADFAAYETYACPERRPLRAPLAALYGRADALTPAGQVQPWQGYTTASFALHGLEGGHFFTQSSRAEVLELLRRLLQPAEAVAPLPAAPAPGPDPAPARGVR
jgi:surfactin synthase thioesterase subunit